ncbi:MAG: undecaprenyl-diphosphate phosphatase [Elusimicrobiota bacterium]
MTYAQAGLLGALQGLTEFLPVSSSAHLVLAPWALGFRDPGLAFDVALHLGTLVAIVATFGRRWSEIVLGAIREPRGEQARLFFLLAMATLPAAAAGLALEKQAEESFRNPLLIAGVLVVFGLILGASESWGSRRRQWAQIGWRVFLAVGAAQALAVIPGVSRSGATISAGLFLGLTPASAAELSFLLSAPIIAGAAAHKLGHIALADLTGPFVFGVVVSALTGWAAVRLFLRCLGRWGLRPYVIYRLALAAGVFALYFVR